MAIAALLKRIADDRNVRHHTGMRSRAEARHDRQNEDHALFLTGTS